ncbi:MAG: ketoacyl-ACP synthase III, partial [Candidatus Margulisiibacteriota bacterium]
DPKQIARIKNVIGLNERYVSDVDTTTADLCQEAAIILLKGLNVNIQDIDGLILVTQTPDYYSQPFTAACLHAKLGLSKDCLAYDVNLGCSGFVYGQWLAHMMVSSGTCKNVLLLVGDTTSKICHPRDRAVAPLFGDAGTATLIQRSQQENPTFFTLHTDGTGFHNIIVPAGGCRMPRSSETSIEVEYDDGNVRTKEHLYMNGGEVFNFTMRELPPAMKEIFEFSGKTIEQIDYVVFHQANKYIITNIARRLNLPMDKAPAETTGRYGNLSSASIPATICDVLSNEVSSSSKELVLAGFGVGFSWATCAVKLDSIFCPEVQLYKGNDK